MATEEDTGRHLELIPLQKFRWDSPIGLVLSEKRVILYEALSI